MLKLKLIEYYLSEKIFDNGSGYINGSLKINERIYISRSLQILVSGRSIVKYGACWLFSVRLLILDFRYQEHEKS